MFKYCMASFQSSCISAVKAQTRREQATELGKLRLLDRPEHTKPPAPLVREEISYHLLSSSSGSRLLAICRNRNP